jgi:hypothetical protein
MQDVNHPGSPLSADAEPSKAQKLAIGLIIALYIVLSIAYSMTRRPWSDEGWFASASYSLAQDGVMATRILEPIGIHQGMDKHTYWVMPLHLILTGYWFKAFGFGLVSMRVISILFGLALLGSFYVLVSHFSGNRKIGLLAVALIATDYPHITGAAFGRMDMMAASLGFSGLAVYILLRERNWPLAVFLSNTIVCAAGMTHFLGVLPLLSLVFLTIYYDRQKIRFKTVAIAAIPYMIAAVSWGYYITQNWEDFRVQFSANAQAGDRLSTIYKPWLGVLTEAKVRYLVGYGLGPHSVGNSNLVAFKAFGLAALVLGLVGVLFNSQLRKQKGIRALLITLLIYFGVMTVLDGQKLPTYLIHIVPLFLSLLAIWVYWLWSRRSVPRWLIAAGVAGLCLLNIAGIAWKIKKNEYKNHYVPAVSFLKQNLKDNTLIMGSAELGFDLNFPKQLIDDPFLGYKTGKKPDYIVVDEIYEDAFEGSRKHRPQIYQHIQTVLKEYDLVYDHSYYKIYVRPQDRAASGHTQPAAEAPSLPR